MAGWEIPHEGFFPRWEVQHRTEWWVREDFDTLVRREKSTAMASLTASLVLWNVTSRLAPAMNGRLVGLICGPTFRNTTDVVIASEI